MFHTIFSRLCKYVALGACAALLCLPAQFASAAQAGGYTGPGPDITTAEQVKTMADDANVALKGKIVRHLGGKKYLFQDETGTVTLEISAKRWNNLQVGAEDIVVIHGEIDKDWTTVEVEVKRIDKM